MNTNCVLNFVIVVFSSSQGSHASWKVLDFLRKISRPWKVLENGFGPVQRPGNLEFSRLWCGRQTQWCRCKFVASFWQAEWKHLASGVFASLPPPCSLFAIFQWQWSTYTGGWMLLSYDVYMYVCIVIILPAKARKYVFLPALVSVCVSVCDHDN